MATHAPADTAFFPKWHELVSSFELGTIKATNAIAFAAVIEQFITDHGDLLLDINMLVKLKIAGVHRTEESQAGHRQPEQTPAKLAREVAN